MKNRMAMYEISIKILFQFVCFTTEFLKIKILMVNL